MQFVRTDSPQHNSGSRHYPQCCETYCANWPRRNSQRNGRSPGSRRARDSPVVLQFLLHFIAAIPVYPNAPQLFSCHFLLMQYSTLKGCGEDRNLIFSGPPMEAFMSPSFQTIPSTSVFLQTKCWARVWAAGWACPRSVQTALDHSKPLGWVEIRHPFHPLRGQRFPVLKTKRTGGVDTLILRGSGAGTFSVAREWTDRADPSPWDELALTPQRLEASLIFELVTLLERLVHPSQKEIDQ
jgi:hypothetical protein